VQRAQDADVRLEGDVGLIDIAAEWFRCISMPYPATGAVSAS